MSLENWSLDISNWGQACFQTNIKSTNQQSGRVAKIVIQRDKLSLNLGRHWRTFILINIIFTNIILGRLYLFSIFTVVEKFKSMSKARWINLIIMLLFYAPAHAQPSHIDGMELIDSLLNVLPTLQNDTGKVKALNQLAFRYFTYYPEKGLYYGDQGRALAVKLGWKKGEAKAYNAIGANYWAENNFIKSQDYYLKSLKINEKLNDYQEVARNLHNIGDIYEIEYNYPKALEYYKKSLGLSISVHDTFAIYGTEGNIAEVYKAQKNYIAATGYLNDAIKIAMQQRWQRLQGADIVDLGAVQAEQGNFTVAVKDEQTALSIFKRIVHNPIKDDIANAYGNLGAVYYKKGDYDLSAIYFKKANYEYERLPGIWAKSKAAECLVKLAKGYYMAANKTEGRPGTASTTVSRNLDLTRAVDTLHAAISALKNFRDWSGLRDAFLCLSDAYQLDRNYAASLLAYKQYIVFKDSVSNAERDKQITSKTLQYEFEKQKDSLRDINVLQAATVRSLVQQKELTQLKSKQQIFYIAAIAAFFGFIAVFFIYRYRNRQLHLARVLTKERVEYQLGEVRQKNKVIQATLTTLISQMNPHFIFNALNTIQSYVYSNDKRSAAYYLGKFSDLTRKILHNSQKELISLDEEIEQLQLYIEIEKARFGDSIVININVDPALDTEYIMLPPMLIQPHVENAIKHGLLHQNGEKKLSVTITQKQDRGEVEIEISDTGVGRQKSLSINRQKSGHQSFATTATEKRIELINRIFDQQISLEIIDKKDSEGNAAGTVVIIYLPVMFGQIRSAV
jgi:tetratricopeptide (TPR) repeat protein